MLKEERHMEKYKVILVDDEIEKQSRQWNIRWTGMDWALRCQAVQPME